MAGLIAVITDGLGSTRLDIYDSETMRLLPRRDGWSRSGEVIASTDGRLWFNWPEIMEQFLDEIRALSDRIAVIYEGKIMGIVDGPSATVEQLGLMMAGVEEKPE